ncbi:hypothetical protein MNBD_GAMMA26-970 [hydrothermal vent metagenome]|uniref:Rap1a immunity protein domain-containing protein n=1 Tax=hydrothermal vent metagenome TaxID=652676 RepID=A0A3B1AWS9_9ZZZZ
MRKYKSVSKCLLLILLLLPLTSANAEKPQLLGYGVKLCEAYVTAYEGWDAGQEKQIAQYLHFRDWLTGFVSGLSLAMGSDVLRGVEVAGAMRRIQLHCDEHPTEEFFTAAFTLIKMLDKLERGESKE